MTHYGSNKPNKDGTATPQYKIDQRFRETIQGESLTILEQATLQSVANGITLYDAMLGFEFSPSRIPMGETATIQKVRRRFAKAIAKALDGEPSMLYAFEKLLNDAKEECNRLSDRRAAKKQRDTEAVDEVKKMEQQLRNE